MLICIRTMADNAFEWARRNGKLFKSEIHGAEEADIPLEWTWETSNESGQKTGFSSSFSMDVPSHTSGILPRFLSVSMSPSPSLGCSPAHSPVSRYVFFSVDSAEPRTRTVFCWTRPTRTWESSRWKRARTRPPIPLLSLGLRLRPSERKPPEL